MSRRSHPPSYSRHSSGQARVRIDGKIHYLGPYGSEESHRRYARLIAGWHARQDEAPKDATVGQLTLLYLEHCASHYRKNGQETSQAHVIRSALRRLNALHRSTLAAEFSPRMLKTVREGMISEGLSRSTINGSVGNIRRMFRWAVSEELVPAVLLVGLETVRDLQAGRSAAREPEPVKPVPDALVDAIHEHVSPAVWGIIQFQRLTGARPGEAVAVRGCDLNTSGPVWEYRPESHKNQHHGKGRTVMIGPKAQGALKPFLRANLSEYLFSPDDCGSRPYTTDTYGNAVLRGCEKAFGMPKHLRYIGRHVSQQKGLTEEQRAELRERLRHEAATWRRQHAWSPNRLRHNFATRARREFGIEAARVTLGHSSAVTSEIYAEKDYEAAKAVVAKIG